MNLSWDVDEDGLLNVVVDGAHDLVLNSSWSSLVNGSWDVVDDGLLNGVKDGLCTRFLDLSWDSLGDGSWDSLGNVSCSVLNDGPWDVVNDLSCNLLIDGVVFDDLNFIIGRVTSDNVRGVSGGAAPSIAVGGG